MYHLKSVNIGNEELFWVVFENGNIMFNMVTDYFEDEAIYSIKNLLEVRLKDIKKKYKRELSDTCTFSNIVLELQTYLYDLIQMRVLYLNYNKKYDIYNRVK